VALGLVEHSGLSADRVGPRGLERLQRATRAHDGAFDEIRLVVSQKLKTTALLHYADPEGNIGRRPVSGRLLGS